MAGRRPSLLVPLFELKKIDAPRGTPNILITSYRGRIVNAFLFSIFPGINSPD